MGIYTTQMREGYHVVGIEKAEKRYLQASFAYALVEANRGENEPLEDESKKGQFRHTIRLKIENNYGADMPDCIVPCKPVGDYFLCRNPYHVKKHDAWLLVHPDGTAFFTASTPALCRIYLHTISDKLKLAN